MRAYGEFVVVDVMHKRLPTRLLRIAHRACQAEGAERRGADFVLGGAAAEGLLDAEDEGLEGDGSCDRRSKHAFFDVHEDF